MCKADFLYFILKPLVKRIFYRKYNVIEKVSVLPKKGNPYLLIGHHVNADDPILINAYSDHLIRFLYADANKKYLFRSVMLKSLDMIPFAKNSADFKSIRQIKKRLALGQAIGFFPEGGASWDGRTEHIIKASSKLIKLMDVPVYGVRFYGGYLSKPRWSKYPRKGQLIIETYPIFSKAELQRVDVEQVHKKINDLLSYSEASWQKEACRFFNGKRRAESIERLLYACPLCSSFNTFSSKGSTFTCEACHSLFEYTAEGTPKCLTDASWEEFSNFEEWNMWQQKHLSAHFEGVSETTPIILNHVDIFIQNQKFEGTLTYDLDYCLLQRTGEKSPLKISLVNMKSPSITFSNNVEFFYNNEKFRLVFLDKSNFSAKLFYDILRILKEKKDEYQLEQHY